jgi:hypothetical protein
MAENPIALFPSPSSELPRPPFWPEETTKNRGNHPAPTAIARCLPFKRRRQDLSMAKTKKLHLPKPRRVDTEDRMSKVSPENADHLRRHMPTGILKKHQLL